MQYLPINKVKILREKYVQFHTNYANYKLYNRQHKIKQKCSTTKDCGQY